MSGQVSSLFAHKVARAAADSAGRDMPYRNELLRAVGIEPAAPVNSEIMIEADSYYSLCERIVEEVPSGRAIAIKVGTSMDIDDYGAFGLAWKSSVNLASSFERMERYGKILTNVSLYQTMETKEDVSILLHRDGMHRLGLCISNEQTIVAIAHVCRAVSAAHLEFKRISFKHPAPEDLTPYSEFFDCPVQFGADQNAISVDWENALKPNKLSDPALSKYFDAHLEKELADQHSDTVLGQRIRIMVAQSLSEGVPTLSSIATQLGTSVRTLQRRLTEQNLSFQTLVDEARRQLAEKLLAETRYSLAEVAFLTGFAEQSTFTRAFKRWAGQTPRSFRIDLENRWK